MVPPTSTTAGFTIGPVASGDLRAVMRLAWKHRSPPLPGVFFEQAAQRAPDLFRVVHDDASEVAGFILTLRLPVQTQDALMLVVRPELVGHGLRRALLHEVKAQLARAGERVMLVSVDADDQELVGFYEREGFRVMGVDSAAASRSSLLLAAPLAV